MPSLMQKLSDYFSRHSKRDVRKPSQDKVRSFTHYDLRPAASALLDKIKSKTEAVQGPVVVLMGENHASPCHHLLRQLVVERLLGTTAAPALMIHDRRPRLAYGLERAHDSFITGIENHLSASLSKEERACIYRADPHGQNFLKFTALLCEDSYGMLYNEASFLRRHAISTRSNDTAMLFEEGDVLAGTGSRMYLDATDEETRQLIARYAPENIGQRIGATEKLGMGLRNRMIVERSSRHIQDAQADIYIQVCGALHVAGGRVSRRASPYEYKDSLCAMFKEAGFSVVPVFPTIAPDEHPLLTCLPVESRPAMLSDGVIVPYFNDVSILGPVVSSSVMTAIQNDSGDEFKTYSVWSRTDDQRVREAFSFLHWLSDTIGRDVSVPYDGGLDVQSAPVRVMVSRHP